MQELWYSRPGLSVDLHIAVLIIDKRIILASLIHEIVVHLLIHGGA